MITWGEVDLLSAVRLLVLLDSWESLLPPISGVTFFLRRLLFSLLHIYISGYLSSSEREDIEIFLREKVAL